MRTRGRFVQDTAEAFARAYGPAAEYKDFSPDTKRFLQILYRRVHASRTLRPKAEQILTAIVDHFLQEHKNPAPDVKTFKGCVCLQPSGIVRYTYDDSDIVVKALNLWCIGVCTTPSKIVHEDANVTILNEFEKEIEEVRKELIDPLKVEPSKKAKRPRTT